MQFRFDDLLQCAKVAQTKEEDFRLGMEPQLHNSLPQDVEGEDSTPRQISAEEFAQIVQEHQKWLSMEGKEGKRANFRNMDLRAIDFTGQHLPEASFRGALLAGVTFTNADLQGADLAEVDLQRANLRGAFLMGANFARANLRYADMQGADLTAANFGAAVMEGASLMAAKMHRANLRETDLKGAVLRHAQMIEANLRGANLWTAILEDADMSQADCRDTNFESAQFERTNIQDAVFRGANLSGVDMNKTDFSKAQDVSPEFHLQSYQNEKRKIEEEQAQLLIQRQQVEETERRLELQIAELERQKAALAEMHTAEQSDVYRLKELSRSFVTYSAIWLIALLGTAGVVVLLASDIKREDLNLLEIGVVFGVLGGILLLFVLTWWRSVQAIRVLNRVEKQKRGVEGSDVEKRVSKLSRTERKAAKNQAENPPVPAFQPMVNEKPEPAQPGVFGRKDRQPALP